MNRDIEFLYEVGMLRHLPRQWQRFGGVNFGDLADHHFRVMWIALSIAAHEGRVDTAKIMKMALVHDIAESRTNDVDYLSRQYVKRDEDKGLRDMLEGTVLKDEFLAIAKEYEERESLESKIVKDADNLDVDLELYEQAANGVNIFEKKKAMRQQVADTKLYTQTARDMFEALKTVDPHDWHLNAQSNRFKGGDWKAQA